MTVTARTYDFPLSLRWLAGRRTIVSVHGKNDLEVATPPEFAHGVEGVWSPEDLLVGSIASCFAVTLLAVADRRKVPVRSLDIRASGHVERRDDGRLGFTEAVLHVAFDTEPDALAEAASVAAAAERGCLVSTSLGFPVRVELDLRTAPRLAAAL